MKKSSSKSPEKNHEIPSPLVIKQEPLETTVPKVLPRYYGRKRSDDSSSESSEDENQDQDSEMKPAQNP